MATSGSTSGATPGVAPVSRETALFVSAFVDELMRAGVWDVVVSPGSRSTPLSMVADASDMNLYVDVDERGAAFFALGLAKAKGRPVAVVCTSGTAVANWYPAVMEAETSRVPLIFCSGDRPARLQQVGAPQTCDQLKAFGCHVAGFWNMPEPSDAPEKIAYARQIAREAVIAAWARPCACGPVHVNFPFDDPLKPDLSAPGLFTVGRCEAADDLPAVVRAESGYTAIPESQASRLATYLSEHTTIILAGENTLTPGALPGDREQEACLLQVLAGRLDAPVLADPLSNLRAFDQPSFIGCADAIFANGAQPDFDCVVRFGRHPVSKSVYSALEKTPHVQIVVDPQATRDFTAKTTTFVTATPMAFVSALLDALSSSEVPQRKNAPAALAAAMRGTASPPEALRRVGVGNIQAWRALEVEYAARAAAVAQNGADDFEGTYVRELVDGLPEGALLFTASSMSVRALDTFLPVGTRARVLCNRGLNGIDGTTSSALGAAQAAVQTAFYPSDQTVFLTGDLAFLHDLNALALQGEFRIRAQAGRTTPKVVVVLLNNFGGAIFDMLPQASDDAYFQRLFLTPHATDFEHIAAAFGVPYAQVSTREGFKEAYGRFLGCEGINLVEVRLPLRGVRGRYAPYK